MLKFCIRIVLSWVFYVFTSLVNAAPPIRAVTKVLNFVGKTCEIVGLIVLLGSIFL